MSIELTDDGTMDTVVRCSECGAEGRYNYDGGAGDSECAPVCASRVAFGECTCGRAEEDCNAFVDWAIEDFTADHECEAERTFEDDELDDARQREQEDHDRNQMYEPGRWRVRDK